MQKRQQIALSLAKNSILEEFGNIQAHQKLQALEQEILSQDIKPLTDKKASFVTLKINKKNLRGCIGSIVPIMPLYKDIIKNAKNAAFADPRFNPLQPQETENLYVEISVLTEPQEIKFSSVDQLLHYLYTKKPGLIIEMEGKSATFLPSVWEELPDPAEFLTHLLLKAWIDPKYFMLNFDKANIFVYFAEEFGDWWKNID